MEVKGTTPFEATTPANIKGISSGMGRPKPPNIREMKITQCNKIELSDEIKLGRSDSTDYLLEMIKTKHLSSKLRI